MLERDPTRSKCALEGCERSVVRRAGGGRPRLYCSDAHRAEARRRRLSAHSPGGHADTDPLHVARRLLGDALVHLDRAATGNVTLDGAVVAEVRARATAEVLVAQQLAADATRQVTVTRAQLERERSEWQSASRELAEQRALDVATLEELSGALEGARAELEHELLRHHGDVDELTGRLHAHAVAHEGAIADAEGAADVLRAHLASAIAALEHAERRAADAEEAARRNAETGRDLEVRTSRAEERAAQAVDQLRRLESDLKAARKDLVAERRHRGAIVTELRRQRAGTIRAARTPKSRATS